MQLASFYLEESYICMYGRLQGIQEVEMQDDGAAEEVSDATLAKEEPLRLTSRSASAVELLLVWTAVLFVLYECQRSE